MQKPGALTLTLVAALFITSMAETRRAAAQQELDTVRCAEGGIDGDHGGSDGGVGVELDRAAQIDVMPGAEVVPGQRHHLIAYVQQPVSNSSSNPAVTWQYVSRDGGRHWRYSSALGGG